MGVGGEIVEVNEKVINRPELVNNDPYEEGWIVKIKMGNPDEYNKLLSSEEYKKLVEQELH